MHNGCADSNPRLGALARAGAALFIVILSGCTAMRPVKTSYIESVQPKVVRITDGTGSYYMIGAHLQGDTLMGFVQRPGGAIGEFRELALGDVTKVEAQQYAGGKTVLAITGGILAWAGFTYLVIRQVESGGNF